MVDVMARACSLIGVARERIALEGAASGNPPREIQDAANGLLAELQVWDHGFNYTPYHVRTQYGNHCYRHGMRIALMRDVLGLDQDNERIVSCAHAIIELARELDFEKGPSMNWYVVAVPNTFPTDPQAPVAPHAGWIPPGLRYGDAHRLPQPARVPRSAHVL